jgi:hypothetical protein
MEHGSTEMRIALRSGKNPWHVLSPATTYRKNVFGNNVGNLAFSHAAHRTLSTSTSVVESNRFTVSAAEAARINAECDVFVLPLANAFRLSFASALTRLTAMIEELTVPVVVLGVAAQGTLDYDASRLTRIEPLVKRFVSAVLDRSATIGVRGEFTANYLASLGFSAVDVIGCPAMYLHGADLQVVPKRPALAVDAKLSIGVSPYVKAMGKLLARHLARYPHLTYIPQDLETLGKLLLGPVADPHPIASDLPLHLTNRVFTEDKARFFVDPVPWLKHLAGRDFYFGSRIHGSIMALLAGTPATVLAHDSRTLELAEFHQIPHRRIADGRKVGAARLYDEMDLDALHRTHAANFTNYVEFLERNGLPHIWQAGESAAGFDERVAATRFPAAVRMPTRATRTVAPVTRLRLRARRLAVRTKPQRRLELRAQRPQQREEAQISAVPEVADAGRAARSGLVADLSLHDGCV